MTDSSLELRAAIDAANRAEARFNRFLALKTDGKNPVIRAVGRLGVQLTRSSVIGATEYADMLSDLDVLGRQSPDA